MSAFDTLSGLHPKAVFLRALLVEALSFKGQLLVSLGKGGTVLPRLWVVPEESDRWADEPQPLYCGNDVKRLATIIHKRAIRRARRMGLRDG